jgi:DNA gyrase subunit A
VTERGIGKRTDIKEYRVSHRGGKGVFTIKVSEKTGEMVTLREVLEDDDIMIITTNGVIIRQSVAKVSVQGRNTQGVKLIRLDENDLVSDVASVVKEENGNGDEDSEENEE